MTAEQKEKIKQDLIDEIVWSPTQSEVACIYQDEGKETVEKMQRFYKNLEELRTKCLRSLI